MFLVDTKVFRFVVKGVKALFLGGAKTVSLQTTLGHTCQVTRFRRVTPGNRACHPHFPEHSSVLPVLCTSIVVPVSRPAASYYPTFLL
jgi:hypothetical protein